jgi:hypothetical protein
MTMASRIEMAHSEHGLMPSTNPMTIVDTTSDLSPTLTRPTNGTSTSASGLSVGTSQPAGSAHVPSPARPYTPCGIGSPRSAVSIVLRMSSLIADV